MGIETLAIVLVVSSSTSAFALILSRGLDSTNETAWFRTLCSSLCCLPNAIDHGVDCFCSGQVGVLFTLQDRVLVRFVLLLGAVSSAGHDSS